MARKDVSGVARIGPWQISAVKRTALRRAASCVVERLETRQLLSVTPSETLALAPLANVQLPQPGYQARLDIGSTDAVDATVVNIPDANLQAAIRSELGKPTGAITDADMQRLTSLNAINSGVSDLSGLEYASNLTSLYFYGNQINDISPLSGLTQLRDLDLCDNQISDISALSGMTQLQYLNLYENRISDISALSGLSAANGLSYVDVTWNMLDLSRGSAAMAMIEGWMDSGVFVDYLPQHWRGPVVSIADQNLAQAIQNQLWISGEIRAGDMLNLTYLEGSYGDIRDLSGLEYATNLTSLYLPDNLISDISALSGMTDLQYLDLGNNRISDISPLSGLTQLQELSLRGNQISDISALSGLSAANGLYSVDVTWNLLDLSAGSATMDMIQGWVESGVTVDYDPQHAPGTVVDFADRHLQWAVWYELGAWGGVTTGDLLNLTTLNAADGDYGGVTSDLHGLEYATNLTSLDLYGNRISDVSPLAGLTQLQYLDLGSNRISDVSPLAGLTQLQYLDLDRNRIADASSLAGLTQLQDLVLYGNQISDTSPLSGLTQLQSLDLGSNRISDISALGGLSAANGLSYVDVTWNMLDVSPGSAAMDVIQGWIDGGVVVYYDPQHAPGAVMNFVDPRLQGAICEQVGTWGTLTTGDMLNLTGLDAGWYGISDLHGLEYATNLTSLYLSENQISDISPLSGLTQLQYLYLYENRISDISPLSGLTQLRYLYLSENRISDTSPLVGLTQLQDLDLYRNQISDISALSGLSAANGLDYVNVSENLLDVSPGSAAMNIIQAWMDSGVEVYYLPQHQPAINDNFADAIEITGIAGSTAGSNWGATQEADEGAASVWWKWTAPGDTSATFDVGDSSFGAVLRVYTGTNLANLTLIGLGDDGYGSFTFDATSGTTYWICVAGYYEEEEMGWEEMGDITLDWWTPLLPVNNAPTDIGLSNVSVAENQSVGTVVGTLSTTDLDAGDTFAYSLVSGTGSTDNASFTISGNQLLTAASFDFETKSSYSIRVRTTDQGGLFYEKVFTISVTDVDDTAPTVTVVYVRGSSWTSGYLSFLAGNLAGSSATYGYAIPVGTGATQLQTLPWRNLNRISLGFSEDVSIAQAQFAIAGSVGSYSVSGFAYSSADHVATWSLSAAIGPDKLYVATPGTGTAAVKDVAGNALDGEWANPASYSQSGSSDSFPSGNGTAGGDFAFRFDVLPGDSSGGSLGKVNVADVLQSKGRSSLPVSIGTYRSDFDGNNLVNVADVLYVKSKSSVYSLPVNPPLVLVFGPVFSQMSLLLGNYSRNLW